MKGRCFLLYFEYNIINAHLQLLCIKEYILFALDNAKQSITNQYLQ